VRVTDPVFVAQRQVWREDVGFSEGGRTIPEETAIALSYDGGSYAVMMATPRDLEDFAIGFSLSEGVISSPGQITGLDVIPLDNGIDIQMWLDASRADGLRERRRHIAGPTGCGLCGIDSIAEAVKPAAIVATGLQVSPQQIMAAMAALPPLQQLNLATRAVHAAAFWHPRQGVVALREDVGRHNALDKLAGALARQSLSGADGIVLLTSRVSVEMVQKTAAMGTSVIVSVSAPTALAVRTAEAAGITLCAIARTDGFEVFSHMHRISSGASSDVA
jgi:FdhD protein